MNLDTWQEILATLRRNRLRTLLTALGVFWGIFMLLLMLGFGNGLRAGIERQMSDRAPNAIFVFAGRASLPYDGLPPGRRIQLTNDDVPAIASVPGVEHVAPRNSLGGWRGGITVVRGSRTGSYSVMGDYPVLRYIEPVTIARGRFINDLDVRDRRKVAVIGEQVLTELFGRDADPIGGHIRVQGVYFQVVGVIRAPEGGDRGERLAATIFLPFSTFQQAYNFGDRVRFLAVTAEAGEDAGVVEDRIRSVLASRHRFAPHDIQAVRSWNMGKEYDRIQTLFGGIALFVWIVGILTLLAGVVGVSNIMVIVVRERTKEIGVRKALGATPLSIIALILQESVVLTALAGYAGVVAAVGLLEAFGIWIAGADGSIPMAAPHIELSTALVATVVIIVSGALAGIIPARLAAAVNPVEALRAE
jgi:putative ABC transport system permease protein